jgi:putative ABC transport system permease protein
VSAAQIQSIFLSAFLQGLAYSFMVLGVYIAFRVLDFPDLTVDGSLTLGASVTATLMAAGHSPFLSTAAGVGAGLVAGATTGSLHMLLKSRESDSTNYGPKLLAGILVMTALYTVNLRVMGGSNVSLLGVNGVFDDIGKAFGVSMNGWYLVAGFGVLMLIVKYVLDWFLHTEFGLCLRATGDNEQMIRAAGTNTSLMRIVGLSMANGLVALSGALVSQWQGFSDIGMGIGTIVAGLASVIIGEVIFGARGIGWVLFSVIGGSFVYRLLIAVSLQLGIGPNDIKALTAGLVVVALSVPTVRKMVVRS